MTNTPQFFKERPVLVKQDFDKVGEKNHTAISAIKEFIDNSKDNGGRKISIELIDNKVDNSGDYGLRSLAKYLPHDRLRFGIF